MNALNEILAWSQSAPAWLRDALRRIVTASDLSDADITELVELCKVPKDQAPARSRRTLCPRSTRQWRQLRARSASRPLHRAENRGSLPSIRPGRDRSGGRGLHARKEGARSGDPGHDAEQSDNKAKGRGCWPYHLVDQFHQPPWPRERGGTARDRASTTKWTTDRLPRRATHSAGLLLDRRVDPRDYLRGRHQHVAPPWGGRRAR